LVVPFAAATSFEIPQGLDLGPGRDHRSPEIEQVEEISHFNAARVGQADRQQGRAAAKLEFAGVELRGIGVGCAFLEFDRKTVFLVELLRSYHRRQKRTERWRAEHNDRNRFRRLSECRHSPRQRQGEGKADANFTHGRPPKTSR